MDDVTQLPPTSTVFNPGIAATPRVSPTTTILANEQTATAITINPGDGSDEFSIPATAYSLPGFRNWALSDEFPQRGQITFSPEGLIIDMCPESLEIHNYIKADVGLIVHGLIRQRDLGRFLADRVLF